MGPMLDYARIAGDDGFGKLVYEPARQCGLALPGLACSGGNLR